MSAEKIVEHEVRVGILPVFKKERIWDLPTTLLFYMAYSTAAWSFLIGGWTGLQVKAVPAIATILLGNAIPLFFLSLYGAIYTRHGVDQFILSRATFGWRGNIVIFILFILINIGWVCYPFYLFSLSIMKVLTVAHAPLPHWMLDEWSGGPLFWVTIGYIISFLIAWKGPIAIGWLVRISSLIMIGILLFLIANVIQIHGVHAIVTATPAYSTGDLLLDAAYALEWNLGLGFAWAYYLGQNVRLSTSERAGFHGPFWGTSYLLGLSAIFAALTALMVQSVDPTDWMLKVGGLTYGTIILILYAFANISSGVPMIYNQGIPVKTVVKPDLKWSLALLTTLPGVALAWPQYFYNYGAFLGIVGTASMAYAAVLLMDYFVIRKGRIDIRAVYYKTGKYWYWGGVNIPAILAMILGILFYWCIYNPVTYGPGFFGTFEIFRHCTAQLPAFAFTCAIYLLLYVIFGRRKE